LIRSIHLILFLAVLLTAGGPAHGQNPGPTTELEGYFIVEGLAKYHHYYLRKFGDTDGPAAFRRYSRNAVIYYAKDLKASDFESVCRSNELFGRLTEVKIIFDPGQMALTEDRDLARAGLEDSWAVWQQLYASIPDSTIAQNHLVSQMIFKGTMQVSPRQGGSKITYRDCEQVEHTCDLPSVLMVPGKELELEYLAPVTFDPRDAALLEKGR
jgi:hypothetical protein